MEIVHLLRAVAVELGPHSARFANQNGTHPTDVRALIALMDAVRAGTELTAGRLGGPLGLNSAGTTALVDRLERAGQVRRRCGARGTGAVSSSKWTSGPSPSGRPSSVRSSTVP